jgi:superfamily II DNA/RNA helicase
MRDPFSAFDLPDALQRGLEKLGFSEPTPVQRQVIPLANAGADLLVTAATGTGKTLAFLLPMLRRFLATPAPRKGIRALILVPTRELAYQIQEHFLQVASFTRLTAGVIVGGVAASHQVNALRRNPDILIATPGRLLDHLERGATDLGDLEFLVLDEADRMLDMGFAPDVMEIIQTCNEERQSLLFSATLSRGGLQSFIDAALRDPHQVQVDSHRAAHPDVRHRRLLADDLEHKHRLLLAYLTQGEGEAAGKILIFTNTRERATALGNFLMGNGQRAASLHGELDQPERIRVLNLLREGRIRVLIATDVAARGLDVPGMDLVINFDVPRSGSDYLHRTGRTGRAGATGLAITLVSPPEWNRMESIERYLQLDLQPLSLPGLEGRYRGPSPSRSAGKKPQSKAPKAPTAKAPKVKERHRDRKNIGKRRQPSATTASAGTEAGFAPLKRQPEPGKGQA